MDECKAREKELNCREVCDNIINYLARADEVLDEIAGSYPPEVERDAEAEGNFAVVENQLADINYRSRRLSERLTALANRI